MVVAQRYDRQARIDGWDQNALEKSRLTIVGDNIFSDYLALSSSALGIGTIRIIATPYDDKNLEMPLLNLSQKSSKEKRLEEIIQKVGNSSLEYIEANMKNRAESWFLEDSNIIVDATLRHESRALVLDYSLQKKSYCELVNFYNKGFNIVNNFENPLILYQKEPTGIDGICAMISSGIVLEEIKKVIFKTNIKREPVDYVFSFAEESKMSYSQLNALVVGAGALGNFVALGLTNLGLKKIEVVDNDTIEETNLNRQIAFFEAVGQTKSEVLAEKCNKICGKKKYIPFVRRFEKEDNVNKYDLVFDCVDNFETRALLSRKCVEAKIPLISGGTSYRAGQTVVYVPNLTSCPNHILNLEKLAELRAEEKKKRERERRGCIHQPDPSVIMTNQVTAGLMINGMRQVFNSDLFSNPVNGQVRYDTIGAVRLGKIENAEKCGD